MYRLTIFCSEKISFHNITEKMLFKIKRVKGISISYMCVCVYIYIYTHFKNPLRLIYFIKGPILI